MIIRRRSTSRDRLYFIYIFLNGNDGELGSLQTPARKKELLPLGQHFAVYLSENTL